MGYSRHKARLVGAAVAAGGMAVVVIGVTGAHPDWMDWLFRCGAAPFRHDCGDGEIPWGIVFMGLMAVGVGLLMLAGEVRTRHGGISFRVHFARHPDARAPGDAPPRSEGPPPQSEGPPPQSEGLPPG